MNTETLSVIKAALPPGYEKQISKMVGCSVGTVHNIMNGKHCSRSGYREKVMGAALKLAEEKLKVWKQAEQTASALEQFSREMEALQVGKEG